MAVVGTALPFRARGTYGVYVVCNDTEGCRGGGTGPLRADRGLAAARVGVDGGEAVERLDTDDVGDDVDDESGVTETLGGKDIGVGTTSG